jgi:hypothetical protein
MGIRLRQVEDLAKELKSDKKQTLARLTNLGVKVIDGYFDAVRFEAAVQEPSWLRGKRNEWSLSPRTGLGAVKFLLDPLGISIVEHECRGSNYLMLRRDLSAGVKGAMANSARGKVAAVVSAGSRLSEKKVFCKMYYKGTFSSNKKHKVCAFEINNIKHELAPDYYLGMCFEGPLLWAFDRDDMLEYHAKLKKSEYGKVYDGLSISADQANRELGGVHALVDELSLWLLKDAKQLGL